MAPIYIHIYIYILKYSTHSCFATGIMPHRMICLYTTFGVTQPMTQDGGKLFFPPEGKKWK